MSAIGTEDFFVLWFSPCIFHLHERVQALLPTGNVISETIPFYNKNSTETCVRKMNLITIEWLSHNNLISWRQEDLNPPEELHKRDWWIHQLLQASQRSPDNISYLLFYRYHQLKKSRHSSPSIMLFFASGAKLTVESALSQCDTFKNILICF